MRDRQTDTDIQTNRHADTDRQKQKNLPVRLRMQCLLNVIMGEAEGVVSLRLLAQGTSVLESQVKAIEANKCVCVCVCVCVCDLPSLPLSQVEETDEGIDYSRLKQQERIYFYDDVILYEDELADNGTAVLSVKIVSVPQSGGDGQ